MIKPLKIFAASTEYITLNVTYLVEGILADPTNAKVEMAFLPPDISPIEENWVNANWENSGTRYAALCLVGINGTINLSVGFYNVWLRMTIGPEIIVKRAGSLTVE